MVFGLLDLLGISYRPALADLPDQRGWRISKSADYGSLNTFARGRLDTAKIRRMCSLVKCTFGSSYVGFFAGAHWPLTGRKRCAVSRSKWDSPLHDTAGCLCSRVLRFGG
jgi:Tn3 transposase DDE domain